MATTSTILKGDRAILMLPYCPAGFADHMESDSTRANSHASRLSSDQDAAVGMEDMALALAQLLEDYRAVTTVRSGTLIPLTPHPPTPVTFPWRDRETVPSVGLCPPPLA